MKRTMLCLFIVCVLLFLCACSASVPSTAPSHEGAPGAAMDEAIPSGNGPADAGGIADTPALPSGESDTASIAAQNGGRKLIRNASYSVVTEDFGQTISLLEAEIEKSGGYVQSSDIKEGAENERSSAAYTIRVPIGQYGGFKRIMSSLGTITESSEGGDDVTEQYFDVESRLALLKAQEARVLTFIENAETLDEIFKIEDELTRIRTEIEQLTTTLRRYDDLVSYATIEVLIIKYAVHEPTPPPENPTFGMRASQNLEDSMDAFLRLVQGIVIVLIWLLPYLVILLLGGGIALTIVLIRRKKRKATQSKPETDEPAETE